ncbi:hypothetical protein ACFSQ7_41505 [Paenibacillus rhizoplanae]
MNGNIHPVERLLRVNQPVVFCCNDTIADLNKPQGTGAGAAGIGSLKNLSQ